MSTTIKIDAAGRLVLPRAVRERLHLRGGSRLKLDLEADSVRLTPEPDIDVGIARRGKRLVIIGTPSLEKGDVVKAIKADRKEREERVLPERRNS